MTPREVKVDLEALARNSIARIIVLLSIDRSTINYAQSAINL
jgi:hypothetical protein